MPIRSAINQPNQLPPGAGNKHIKALPKAQLPHNIIGEITEPIAHIPHNTTALLLPRTDGTILAARMLAGKDCTQLSHMQQHNTFHALQRIIRERLTEHAPLPSMDSLVNRIVGVVHALDSGEGIVEIRLLDPFPMSVDIMQTLVGVDRNKVRRHPHMRAVLGMQSVQPLEAVTFQAMIQLDPGGDRSEKWARDAVERVEETVVGEV